MSDDVLDFRTLEVDELRILADAMHSKSENEICAYFEKEFSQMLAAHAGKILFLREVSTDLHFTPFKPDELREAEVEFRALAKQFKTKQRSTAQKFCQLILVRCKGGLEAQEDQGKG